MAACVELVRLRLREVGDAVRSDAYAASIADIKRLHPDLRETRLVRCDDDTYVDILVWESRQSAQRALDESGDIPGFVAWSNLIEEIVSFDMTEEVEVR